MEFVLLGLSESATPDEADAALARARARYHPDRVAQLARADVEALAAEHYDGLVRAHAMVRDRLRTRAMLAPLLATPPARPSTSYRYTNVGGRVTEMGAVDGRAMTDRDLAAHRARLLSLSSSLTPPPTGAS